MSEPANLQNDLRLETSIPAASLESILCTEELLRRQWRPPDYEKENSALVALACALADSPGTILQTLADKVLDVLQADSAGLSLLTKEERRFYWPAIAGAWRLHIGGGTPRDFGPCGDVLDRNIPMLFTHWERRYPYLSIAMPLAEEGLLVPFYVNGKAVGTIWAIAHNDRRKFDVEDLRLLESMGRFASAAYQAVEFIEDLKLEFAAREKAEMELRELTVGLEAQVLIRTAELDQRNNQLADARARLAEEKLCLERSEAFLAEGQRLSRTGTFSWRVATDEITLSEELYRIFEVDPGVPVTLELIVTRVHPEDIRSVHNMMGRARAAVSDFEFEHRLKMPDQSVRYLHVVAHGSHDRDGQPEYIGAVQDITERRLSEEALSKVRFELAHMTRVTSLGALTASIAHEINQPLSGISSNASAALRWIRREKPDLGEAVASLEQIIADSHRASDIITSLRAMFKKDTNERSPVDINDLIPTVLTIVRHDLQRKGVELKTVLKAELPAIAGDKVQLQQVLLNLVVNATEAMHSVQHRVLTVQSELSKRDMVHVSIKDTGTGVDPSDLDRIFKPLFTTKVHGMGFGLSICHSIIESHGGRIWVSTGVGGGSIFQFELPVMQGAR